MSTSASQPDANPLVDQLRQQMDALVRPRRTGLKGLTLGGRRLEEASDQPHFSTGVPALDRLLPEGGLRPGTLVEWLGEGGGSLLAILAAREALAFDRQRRLVVVEWASAAARLYPPAVDAWGLPLASTVWLAAAAQRIDQWWAVDQALRSPAVASVLVWPDAALGSASTRDVASASHRAPDASSKTRSDAHRRRNRDERMFRRWQLAAESSGAVGMVVRCAAARDEPSWADVRWLVHACKDLNASECAAHRIDADATASQPNILQQGPRWQLDVECLRNGCVGSSPRVLCEISCEISCKFTARSQPS